MDQIKARVDAEARHWLGEEGWQVFTTGGDEAWNAVYERFSRESERQHAAGAVCRLGLRVEVICFQGTYGELPDRHRHRR